jgi:hypothetical protein
MQTVAHLRQIQARYANDCNFPQPPAPSPEISNENDVAALIAFREQQLPPVARPGEIENAARGKIVIWRGSPPVSGCSQRLVAPFRVSRYWIAFPKGAQRSLSEPRGSRRASWSAPTPEGTALPSARFSPCSPASTSAPASAPPAFHPTARSAYCAAHRERTADLPPPLPQSTSLLR